MKEENQEDNQEPKKGRVREPSTWGGLGGLLITLIPATPSHLVGYVIGGAVICFLASIALKEGR